MKTLLSRLLPNNWNDTLSLILVIIIPTLWIFDGMGAIEIKPEVAGALIVSWSLLLQFYYRQRPPKE